MTLALNKLEKLKPSDSTKRIRTLFSIRDCSWTRRGATAHRKIACLFRLRLHPLVGNIAGAELWCRLCYPCTERLFARHVFLAKLLPRQCDFGCYVPNPARYSVRSLDTTLATSVLNVTVSRRMLCCFLVTATMFGAVFSVAFWCSFYTCLDLQEKYGIFCEIASLSAESGCGPVFFLFFLRVSLLPCILCSLVA